MEVDDVGVDLRGPDRDVEQGEPRGRHRSVGGEARDSGQPAQRHLGLDARRAGQPTQDDRLHLDPQRARHDCHRPRRRAAEQRPDRLDQQCQRGGAQRRGTRRECRGRIGAECHQLRLVEMRRRAAAQPQPVAEPRHQATGELAGRRGRTCRIHSGDRVEQRRQRRDGAGRERIGQSTETGTARQQDDFGTARRRERERHADRIAGSAGIRPDPQPHRAGARDADRRGDVGQRCGACAGRDAQTDPASERELESADRRRE
jgi:hypothetical protein